MALRTFKDLEIEFYTFVIKNNTFQAKHVQNIYENMVKYAFALMAIPTKQTKAPSYGSRFHKYSISHALLLSYFKIQ